VQDKVSNHNNKNILSAIEWFKGRTLCIATMHAKEQVLAPLLEKHLGVKVCVPYQLNTDVFGTFSGKTKRVVSPLEAALLKIEAAQKITDADLFVASEGSFGPHPQIPFVPADDEILVFKDYANKLEVKARELSFETNFNAAFCKDITEVKAFAEKAQFPAHALVIKKTKEEPDEMFSGITDWDTLNYLAIDMLQKNQSVYLETDMRAMFNPTRMRVIEKACENLIQKLFSCCPFCKTPGFDVTQIISGLLCSWCRRPTNSTAAHIYTCSNCFYKLEKKFPYNKTEEDPMYCDFCNP